MVVIFEGKHSSLSQMYSDLKCPHHLAQEKYDEIPDIPGLTPVGFERWVTLLIQAYPEEEFERLQKAVLKMPISNPDDKKERFPKEISRRLFPDHEDCQARRRIQDSMVECAVGGDLGYPNQKENYPHPDHPPLRGQATENLRVPQRSRGSVKFADQSPTSMSSSTHPRSHFEWERKLHSHSASDDTPSLPSSPPSHSVAREQKRDHALPRGAERSQDGCGRIKPRSESLADLSVKFGHIHSSSSAQPTSLNSDTRRPAESHHPGNPSHYRTSNGSSHRHWGPASCGSSIDNFHRSRSDARGYEQTL